MHWATITIPITVLDELNLIRHVLACPATDTSEQLLQQNRCLTQLPRFSVKLRVPQMHFPPRCLHVMITASLTTQKSSSFHLPPSDPGPSRPHRHPTSSSRLANPHLTRSLWRLELTTHQPQTLLPPGGYQPLLVCVQPANGCTGQALPSPLSAFPWHQTQCWPQRGPCLSTGRYRLCEPT